MSMYAGALHVHAWIFVDSGGFDESLKSAAQEQPMQSECGEKLMLPLTTGKMEFMNRISEMNWLHYDFTETFSAKFKIELLP